MYLSKTLFFHVFYFIFSVIILVLNFIIFTNANIVIELVSLCGILIVGITMYFFTYNNFLGKREQWLIVIFSVAYIAIYLFLSGLLSEIKVCSSITGIYLLINFSLYFLCKSKEYKNTKEKSGKYPRMPGRKGRMWLGYNFQRYDYLKNASMSGAFSRVLCVLSILCFALSILIPILEYC